MYANSGISRQSAQTLNPLYILTTLCVVAFSVLVLFSIDIVFAQAIPESLTKKLAEFKGAEGGQIISVTDEALTREFPGYAFYVLRFRQYPVAVAPPEPLRANNLFVIKSDGSVEHVLNAESLKTLFRTALAVRTDAEARDVAKSWLQLSKEFHQDGFFRFSIPDDSIQVTAAANGGLEVTGKAVVDRQGGNTGEIGASLSFDSAGSLTNVSEVVQIHRGIRPICQATKLLDPDPIVRGMAEQDVLVMGATAKEYLNEQRTKASLELQIAIDKIWQRIVAEGR